MDSTRRTTCDDAVISVNRVGKETEMLDVGRQKG
jgi:hypothetical protein